MSGNAFYAGMSPPPSYHSFEGLWAKQAPHPGASIGRDFGSHVREQDIVARRPTSRHEEITVNRRPREDRRKHHRPRRSSSSHNKTWTAKLVLQGLRSDLFGSNHGDEVSRDSKGRPGTTKLDFTKSSRNIHYTVHNHWHDMAPSEHVPLTKTCPGRDPTKHSDNYFANLMSGAVPAFRLNRHSGPQQPPSWCSHHDRQQTFDDFVSGYRPSLLEELDVEAVGKKVFGGGYRYPLREGHCPPQEYPWWSSDSEAEQGFAGIWGHDCGRHSAGLDGKPDPSMRTSFDRNESIDHGRQNHDRKYDGSQEEERRCQQPPDHNASSWNSEQAMLQAASVLTDYNKRWSYIDTVQQPYPHELPWPTIRADVSFDHMKCDVFSFFARGCGLEPDRSKAPKLDFKPSLRSPYPSYDQRQQECERKMLKQYKQQMQREKLRWHEDKLRRKFPEAIGRDDDRRKAVWAAIAEGSAVCDKRLGSMI
jgi:hypothetical protein